LGGGPRFLKMVDDPYNCLCSGALGTSKENNVPDIIRSRCDRIAFTHTRNVKHMPNIRTATHKEKYSSREVL